jgi:hypothetical protein
MDKEDPKTEEKKGIYHIKIAKIMTEFMQKTIQPY